MTAQRKPTSKGEPVSWGSMLGLAVRRTPCVLFLVVGIVCVLAYHGNWLAALGWAVVFTGVVSNVALGDCLQSVLPMLREYRELERQGRIDRGDPQRKVL